MRDSHFIPQTSFDEVPTVVWPAKTSSQFCPKPSVNLRTKLRKAGNTCQNVCSHGVSSVSHLTKESVNDLMVRRCHFETSLKALLPSFVSLLSQTYHEGNGPIDMLWFEQWMWARGMFISYYSYETLKASRWPLRLNKANSLFRNKMT